MTYQDMVDKLASMDEQQRRQAIQNYWQTVFSDGFIGFLQGQIEACRKMTTTDNEVGVLLDGLEPEVQAALREAALKHVTRLVAVWDSGVVVYQLLQQRSERQGPRGGMVEHGRHRSMPRGVSVAQAVQCYRCGSPVAANGLCGGCMEMQQDWEQDDLEFVQRGQDYLSDQQHIDRIQQDQVYYDAQQDYNTYTNYYSNDS